MYHFTYHPQCDRKPLKPRVTCRLTIKKTSLCWDLWIELKKQQHIAKYKNKKKKKAFESREFYISFVSACNEKRVKLVDFKAAIKDIRSTKPAKYFVNLLKKANLHVRPTDEGRAYVVDFLIQHKLVTQQPVQDLTFDEDDDGDVGKSTSGFGPVRRHASESAAAILPARKRTRLEECSEPVLAYVRQMFRPYCQALIRRELVAKGVRLQDLLSAQVTSRMYHVSLMYHPHVSLMYHPHVSPACIT